MEEQINIDIPNFTLPELPAIGRAAPQLFVDTPEGRKVRQPTMEEQVNFNSREKGVDLTRAIGEYSINDSSPFSDPTIKFRPGVDMEEIYAENDPFTFGDSFAKGWDTLKINSFSTFSNVYAGITEGISQGDFSKVWNNSNTDHLADLTENLDKIRPQFKTQDERENPLSFRNWDSTIKSIIPSLGYAAAGVVDAAATTVGITALSALATAPEGGVGAIPGFFAGLAAGGNVLRNTVSGLWNISKGLNTATKTIGAISAGQKALNLSKMVGSSLFFANSEAALQGELNARQVQKKIQAEHLKSTGEYLSSDELEKMTGDLQRDTYLLNLPLLAASMAFQVPNLLRGKLAPAILESLPVRLMRDKTLKVGSTGLFLTKEWAKESVSEGLEEVGQSLIDKTTEGYYDPFTNRSYIESFVDGTLSMNQETAVEFIGGALAGGVMNLGTFSGYSKTKQRAMDAASAFNSSTNELVHSLSRTNRNHAQLGVAIKNGDMDQVKEIHRDNLRQIIETGRYLGSVDAKRDIIKDLGDMPTGDFNKFTGFNVSESVQKEYVNSLLSEYDRINKVLATRDSAFGYNPFIQEKWFKERATSLEPVFGQSAGTIATKMFEDAKRVIGKVMVEDTEFGMEIQELETSRPDLNSWYAEDFDQRVKEKVQTITGLNLPSDAPLIQSLQGKTLFEQAAILSANEGHTEADRTHIQSVVKARAAKKFYELKLKSYSSNAGQKRLLKEIGHYMEYLYGVPNFTTPVTPVVTPTPSIPVTPTSVPVATIVTTPAAPAVSTPVAPVTPIPVTTPEPTVAEEDNVPDPDPVEVLEGEEFDLPSPAMTRIKVEKYLSDLARRIHDEGNIPWEVSIGGDRVVVKPSTMAAGGYKYELNETESTRPTMVSILENAYINNIPIESKPLSAAQYVKQKMSEDEQLEEIDVFFEAQPDGLQYMKDQMAQLQEGGLLKIECNG